MRVLHLITGLGVGGAERQLYVLASALADAGLDQHVVALTGPGHYQRELESRGVTVTGIGLARGDLSTGAVRRLRQVSAAFDADVIHSWMYHANIAGMIARTGAARSAALVWAIRNSLESPRSYKLLTRLVIYANKWCSDVPDRIIYNSRRSALQHARAGFRSVSQEIIANGIDTRKFVPAQSPQARAAIRASLGLKTDEIVIGSAARMDPSKNHAALLSAFAAIASTTVAVRLILCGTRTDEANRTLVALLHDLGIHRRVSLLGERYDVERVMSSWDIGVNSSIREGFPNAVAECMACEVPCVVTDVGDSTDIVGDTGFVVRAGDAHELERGLRRAMALSVQERRMLGRAARERIDGHYSVQRMIDRHIDLYRDVISERSRRDGARTGGSSWDEPTRT